MPYFFRYDLDYPFCSSMSIYLEGLADLYQRNYCNLDQRTAPTELPPLPTDVSDQMTGSLDNVSDKMEVTDENIRNQRK